MSDTNKYFYNDSSITNKKPYVMVYRTTPLTHLHFPAKENHKPSSNMEDENKIARELVSLISKYLYKRFINISPSEAMTEELFLTKDISRTPGLTPETVIKTDRGMVTVYLTCSACSLTKV